jgi:hypothetical protein
MSSPLNSILFYTTAKAEMICIEDVDTVKSSDRLTRSRAGVAFYVCAEIGGGGEGDSFLKNISFSLSPSLSLSLSLSRSVSLSLFLSLSLTHTHPHTLSLSLSLSLSFSAHTVHWPPLGDRPDIREIKKHKNMRTPTDLRQTLNPSYQRRSHHFEPNHQRRSNQPTSCDKAKSSGKT